MTLIAIIAATLIVCLSPAGSRARGTVRLPAPPTPLGAPPSPPAKDE